MNAIEHALLAVMAASDGNATGAQEHISDAQRHARATARRERQIVEIATLVIEGDADRAAGLGLEHLAAFPDDADLLARVSGEHPMTERISAKSASKQHRPSESST